MPRLRIQDSRGERAVRVTDPFLVGREGADLVLHDDACSRKHFQIRVKDGQCRLLDLGSSNGTFVNGERVEQHALKDGDRIRAGNARLVFVESEADFGLRFITGRRAGEIAPLSEARVTLGRRDNNTVALDDPKLSGMHLEVVAEGQHFVVRDLGSTNGTYLDDRPVTEVALTPGDRIRFGDQEFEFIDLRQDRADEPEDSTPRKLSLTGVSNTRSRGPWVLVALALSLGAAGWFALQGGTPTGGPSIAEIPEAPSGNLLAEDWSFEDAAAVRSLWSSPGDPGWKVSQASKLGAVFRAEPGGGLAVAHRQPVTWGSARGLKITATASAPARSLLSVTVRFSGDKRPGVELEDVAVQQILDNEAGQVLEGVVRIPEGMSEVELGLVARGPGPVRVDDLAVVPTSAQDDSVAVGDLQWKGRGRGFFLEHGAELVEFFQDASDSGDAPVVGSHWLEFTRHDMSLDCAAPHADFAPVRLTALLDPAMAEGGLLAKTGAGTVFGAGRFEFTDVRSVILGHSAERVEWVFGSPCEVSGTPAGDAWRLFVTPSEFPLEVTLRSGFAEESEEAGRLLVEARKAREASHWGQALLAAREIRQRLPYSERVLTQARELEAEMLREIQSEREELERAATAASFLESGIRVEETASKGEALLDQLEGVEGFDEFAAEVAQWKARARELRDRRSESEAAGVRALMETFLANPGREGSARDLAAALDASYGPASTTSAESH